jgi:outer membrane receptor for ferrienterochelin and colicins
MKFIINLLALLFIFHSNLLSETISGRVFGLDESNQKKPLPKASIAIIGSNQGTFTDNNGYFKIELPPKAHFIVVSYVGYERDTLHVHDYHGEIEIVLTPSLKTETINVVGEKSAIEISHSNAVKTETITSKGLQKAACCNLAESFEVSPSVDVEYSDAISGAKRIQLLGLAGNYSQILIEKIPSLRGLGSIYGLLYVPGPWMESIQVSKGSASVTTGFESITGQINIEYKKPENYEPTHINVYGDVMGRSELNTYHTFRIDDKISTMLLAHANYYQNTIDKNNDSFIDKPKVSMLNIQNRWKYEGEVFESVTGARALIENREGGQKGYFNGNNANFYGIKVKTQRFEAFTKNGFIFSDEPFSSLGTIVSFTHHKHESNYGKRLYNGEQNSFYTNILYQFEPFEENGLTLGTSYQYDNYIEHLDNVSISKYESIPGVLAEWNFGSIHDLTILLGFRADFPNGYKTFLTPRFHLRYALDELTTIRASAGKGYRLAHIYAENVGFLASVRNFIVDEKLNPEEAWNYGLNISTVLNLFGTNFTINAEYYRTDFINQVIADLDRSPNAIHFYNLDGKSYSNSFQIDLQFEPIQKLVLTTAYRLNDVKTTYNGKLEKKPLQSPHKGYFNLMYDTPDNGWNFDLTVEYNGSGRLPNTEQNPENLRLAKNFPDFTIVNAQITKRFKLLDIYFGGENLTNFVQKNPILDAGNPFSNHFDSSMIWGPIFGRMFYAGVRVNFN